MSKGKIERIKRVIKREIRTEVRALRKLAPMFGGAVIMLGGLWAWCVLTIGFLG